MSEQTLVVERTTLENALVVVLGAALDWIAQVRPEFGTKPMPLEVREMGAVQAVLAIEDLKQTLGIDGEQIQQLIESRLENGLAELNARADNALDYDTLKNLFTN